MACNWGKCPKGRGTLLTDVDYEIDGTSGGLAIEARLPDEKDDVRNAALLIVSLVS